MVPDSPQVPIVPVRDTGLVALAIASGIEPHQVEFDPIAERTVFHFLNTPTFEEVRKQFTAHSAIIPFHLTLDAIKRTRSLMSAAKARSAR